MNILIVCPSIIPATMYGGTERVVWYLGKELSKMGHKITFLVSKGSFCDFAKVIYLDSKKTYEEQIPASIDIVHFHLNPHETISKPYVVTVHGNSNDLNKLDSNSIFVSRNHANRYGSESYVYNGLDWDDYGKPKLNNKRNYFHFLGKAAWRIKNVKGAIEVIHQTQNERLKVLGGYRLNLKMGFRFTISPRIRFNGMVGGEKKNRLLESSKGLIFPVRWNEPFGLAMTESLYFGCPIFGTPYGSLPEIVIPSVGFLSNNSSELSSAIENANMYSRIDCHDYAVEFFNSKTMAEKYMDNYLKVLSGITLNDKYPVLIEQQTSRFLDWK